MQPLLYSTLVDWYDLIDPVAEHADEASCFRDAFERAIGPRAETLLELGSGAGNNACHLAHRFRCTLSDVAPAMLGLSRAQNPSCEHVEADMRALRLGRTFDAVLVHDAVTYMTSEQDLAAAIETAFVHTRPGGAAIFAPDAFRETFEDATEILEGEGGGRALRCLVWDWDPDPADDTIAVDWAFLLREGAEIRAVHDRHVEGLFSRATWHRLFAASGFQVEPLARPISADEHDEVFLCRRPDR